MEETDLLHGERERPAPKPHRMPPPRCPICDQLSPCYYERTQMKPRSTHFDRYPRLSERVWAAHTGRPHKLNDTFPWLMVIIGLALMGVLMYATWG